jgi:putative peptide zinc metalloprotease protein
MPLVNEVSELERRKKIRVLLRRDLSFSTQKYEGRTFYVVKDPVSLRYYRFKEHERFLLGYMDGGHTLEDAQKAFEQRFRPERLTLEDLEAFTSQLLQAGLVQNETPNAGKQLFDRYKKRRNKQLLQTLTNILYIKIPIYDPDRLLDRMLPYLRFIFTTWFLILSIIVMLSAIALVATNWNMFVSKLPAYHEFFTLKTVVYLWAALGVVKVIHEFGHGLSCKAFGGEVHEMGALFLVFSPCLYCNVSDAWTLPNKWHRIIISAAGIYVELIIAALATFVWWGTENGTFINNLCMSLMVVCSVSTVIFNANPLMRFDGYYVLADWIEIPNLREKSNRYLSQLAQEYCLGIEVPPQPYMEMGRKVLFVSYAIVSYLYRWLVTFSILVFMYSFLEPYKLGVISFVLGTASLGTMVGQPIYQVFKSVHRRGRLPDMKPVRVTLSAVGLAAILAGLLFVPLPNRVRSVAVIQVDPQEAVVVSVPEVGGYLRERLVEDGQKVRAGDVIARMENPELDIKLATNRRAQAALKDQLKDLEEQLVKAGNLPRVMEAIQATRVEIASREMENKELQRQVELLVVRAKRDGTILRMVPRTDVGKYQEGGTPLCLIGDERALRAVLLVPTAQHSLVSVGDKAWIHVHGRGVNSWEGRVTRVATAEAKEIPPQLSNKAGGDVPTQSDAETRHEKPQSQHYIIVVAFNEIDDAIHPGVMARVKIETPWRTLYWQLERYFTTHFTWWI